MKQAITLLLVALGYLLLPGNLLGQTLALQGTVTDAATGEPLIGATIAIQGTTSGTVTDFDGSYTLEEVSANDTLVFSYTGYATQNIPVAGRTRIDVQLQSEAQVLQDIVVIGYGTKQRRDVTGAVASIATEDLEKKPITRLENALQGQAAGVEVTQYSGRPGNALSVRVRGSTSLSAGNEPLYVVDGVPVLSVEAINPADVSSIEVLKDASAAAIYGARAANGVVLITTRQGNAAQPTISLNSYVGTSQVVRQLDLLNTQQYIDLINESYVNAGQPVRLDPADYSANTNWQDEIFRSAPVQNYQLSVGGGSGNTQYYVSGGWFDQSGVIRGSEFNRASFRANLTTDVREWVTLGTNFTIARTTFQSVPDNSRVNQGGVVLGALSTPPLIGIYNPDGTYTQNPLQAWENPVANIEAPSDESTTSRLIGNLFLELKPWENWTFKTSFSTETYYSERDYFLDPFLTQYGRSLEGTANAENYQELIWLSENTISYNREFGDHILGVLGGFTAQSSHFEATVAGAQGFPNAAVPTLNAGSRKTDASSWESQWALLSYLGRVSYKYMDRYLIDVNFRADGSSRFGAGNRYAFFPSVSVGWRLSREPFLSASESIDDAKLRLSIGQTGNQNIGDFSSYGLYATGSNYNFGGVIRPGTRPSTIGNQDLRWETTTQYDLGLDLTLFDYRINITTDYYVKRTNDLLVNVDLPLSTGFGSGIQNLGEVENRGWEFAIRYIPARREGLAWDSRFNISINRNKVIDIGGEDKVIFAGDIPESGFSVIVREGLPLGAFYGFVTEGVNPETGDLVFADLDGDGELTDEDRTVIGDANPDFIAGWGNTFTVGAFDLDLLLQANYGNDVFNASRLETEGMNSVKNASTAVLDRWQRPGDVTEVPRAVFGDPNRNTRISDRFIEDGSFLRLRNVTLTYRVPKTTLDRFGIQNLALYVSGQNLLTFTDYSGYDPEVNRDGGSALSLGIDYGTYPQARMFTGGIRLDF